MNNAIAKTIFPRVLLATTAFALFFAIDTSANEPMDLARIVSIGLSRSPAIKKQAHIWQAAVEKRKEIRGGLFPDIRAKISATDKDYGPGNSTSNAPDYLSYLEATQPIYSGGALTGGLNFYGTSEKIAELELKKTKLQVIYDLITGYFNYAESTQLLRAAKVNEEILKKHVNVIERYEKIGRSRQTDKLQSELNWLNARSLSSGIESTSRQHAEQLRVLLALEEIPNIELPPDLSTLSEVSIDADKVIAQALKNNPSIIIAELNEANVKNQKDLEMSDDLPQLKLVGQVGYRSENLDRHFEGDQKYSSVTLSLEAPLFSGGSSFSKRRRFEQTKLSASRNTEISRLSIDGEIRTAVSVLNSSQQQLELAVIAKKKAQVALDLAARDYQKGLITSSDLINIQRSKFESDNLFIKSQYGYRKADLTLAWLKGENLDQIYTQSKAVK